jgi:hypothetical protein
MASAAARPASIAVQTAAVIEVAGQKVWAYWVIAKAQTGAANAPAAKQALELAKQAAAAALTLQEKDNCYDSLSVAQAEAGDFAGAFESAGAMADARQKARTWNSVAQAQAKAGGIGNLKSWVETLTEPRDVVNACLGAVKGLQGQEEK